MSFDPLSQSLPACSHGGRRTQVEKMFGNKVYNLGVPRLKRKAQKLPIFGRFHDNIAT